MSKRKYRPVKQIRSLSDYENSTAKWFEGRTGKKIHMWNKETLESLQVRTLRQFISMGAIYECERIPPDLTEYYMLRQPETVDKFLKEAALRADGTAQCTLRVFADRGFCKGTVHYPPMTELDYDVYMTYKDFHIVSIECSRKRLCDGLLSDFYDYTLTVRKNRKKGDDVNE